MYQIDPSYLLAGAVAYGAAIYLACLFGFGIERMQIEIKVLTARVNVLAGDPPPNRRAS